MTAADSERRDAGRRRDRRVAKTRAAIAEAFWDLLADSEPSRITISAIARAASIDRKTFYLHYRSIDDLLAALIDDTVGAIYDEYERLRQGDGPVRGADGTVAPDALERDVRRFFDGANAVVMQRHDRCLLLIHRVPAAVLFARMHEAIVAESAVRGPVAALALEQPTLDHVVSYVLGGALTLYARWLEHDGGTPVEAVSALAATMTVKGLSAGCKDAAD